MWSRSSGAFSKSQKRTGRGGDWGRAEIVTLTEQHNVINCLDEDRKRQEKEDKMNRRKSSTRRLNQRAEGRGSSRP